MQQRTDRGGAAWRRWRAFARKAAEVQSKILLGALFLVVVPFAAARRSIGRARVQPPGWRARPHRPADLAAARRQY